MTDTAVGWQERNQEYLAAGLAWLRLRLEHAAGGAAGGAPDDAPLRAAARRLAAASGGEPAPALELLGERFSLSRFERQLLLLCVAMELDTRMPALCARALGERGQPCPTFGLALTLFNEPCWDGLSPRRPLRYWRLIELRRAELQPLIATPLAADERIVHFAKGLDYLDDHLTLLLEPLEPGTWLLPPSYRAVVDRCVDEVRRAPGEVPVLQLVGPDADSLRLVAARAAADLGLAAHRLPSDLLPPQVEELDGLARLWQRERVLSPLALFLDVHERDSGPELAALLGRFLARCAGLVFLAGREARHGVGRPSRVIDVDKPTPGEQREAWTSSLGAGSDGAPMRLAGQFNLDLGSIEEVASVTLAANGGGPDLERRLWNACLAHSRPRMETLAQRLEPKATWSEIVLPAEQESLLRQIAAQVGQRTRVYDDWGFRRRMNRGLGISALFSGASGTGKTMAAEVLANDLALDLYRIDLSSVVNKYIGETEKNLRRLFDAAEDGGAILFFDEADALFGKRSEVKDSHDRYANIEINYLLQRMEAYRGLAILATNMKSALDSAFLRRLRFLVHFPYPDAALRRLIWQGVFPPETPLEPLDLDRLARLDLSGGSIHNVALNASFLAAEAAAPVTMELLLVAAEAEFRKLEKPVQEADFRWPRATEVVA